MHKNNTSHVYHQIKTSTSPLLEIIIRKPRRFRYIQSINLFGCHLDVYRVWCLLSVIILHHNTALSKVIKNKPKRFYAHTLGVNLVCDKYITYFTAPILVEWRTNHVNTTHSTLKSVSLNLKSGGEDQTSNWCEVRNGSLKSSRIH